MIRNIIDKVANHEVISVAVSDDSFAWCSTINVDEYEYVGDDLTFGDGDQELCIRGLSGYEVNEFFDEILLLSADKKKQISLCFVR